MGRAEERRARQRGDHRVVVIGSPGAKPRRSGIRRFLNWKTILGTFLGFCLLGMGAFVVLYMVVSIPQGNADAQRQSNIYKYSDGTVLARTGKVNREIVGLDKVPKKVQLTFVAAENKSFYKDAGVDLKGTARGLINTLSGKGKQGGSTITQQYVKNFYLNQDQTVTRKLKELVISLKLDRQQSKDDILAGYINTSYYGRNSYGIQAAAQAYYGKDASALTVQQGAYLASLLQAPSQYDWGVATATGKRLVTARWNYTLDNMVEEGWLNSAERQAMKFPIPQDPKGVPGLEGQTGYMVDAANGALAKRLVAQGVAANYEDAKAIVDAGGWTITLNIDKSKQTQLEVAVKTKLTSKLDSKKRSVDGDVEAGAVSVDPKTGKVVAMYGGKDYFEHYLNNATRTDYQPASTFKPLIFAAALEQKATTQDGQEITPNTLYDGTSGRSVKGSNIAFAPPNEDDQSYGDVTVQTAMNKSINSVFAQMGVDVGMDKVLRVAGELGMNTETLEAVPAQTLGSMGASPLEMAGAYATLDNHGRKVTPALVASAEHKDRTVDFPNPIGDQVISAQAADTVTSVLTGVVDDGTARVSVAQAVDRNDQQVAGKTGTSDNNKSAWFTGYTPNLVTSVGLFGEVPKDRKETSGTVVKRGTQVSLKGAAGGGRVNGGGFPAQIWAAYTFNAMGQVTDFALDTTQGAAMEPTQTPTISETPSETPSQTPTTEEPTTEPPTSQAPTTPTSEPATTPTTPTTTEPATTPAQTPTDEITQVDPFNPNNQQ
ncbi:penicillin-binding protein [Streptomyces sp. NBC_01136]|uniref:transglycosylase domain-containing protein n=1 Tax=Streptomyces sp. NBC_01136 TaxID=2903754 RepID=UPI00386AD5D5|nr:penicillin-binding protein [Streptomyces sp. NBC_01136]